MPDSDPTQSDATEPVADALVENYSIDEDPSQQSAPLNPDLPQQYVGQEPQMPVEQRQQHQQPQQPAPQDFSTPFAHAEVSLPANAGGGANKAVLWAVIGAVGAVVLLAVGFLAFRALQDPFRTLEMFPTEKYLSNYESVLGSRFRANLTVDAELGGTYGQGRLLSFRDESTQRSLAIMVPPELSQIGFTKGQSYSAELEVKQGGLIHAHAFQKN